MKKTITVEYEMFEDILGLPEVDAQLLNRARQDTVLAYAPYSKFNVAAVALLDNGILISGTNQENASYPVGICAERTLLSAISSQYPTNKAVAIAISYDNKLNDSDKPISPCGICRQTLAEYEQRWNSPIKLILSGLRGKIIVLQSVKDILPFSFSADDMK